MSNGAPNPFQPPHRDGHEAPQEGTGRPGGPDGGGRTARRRSPARTLAPLIVAAWAVLEIWLLTVVADAAGGLTVLLLLAGGFVLGVLVVRRAGRRAWRQLSAAFATPGGPGEAREGAGPRGGNTFAMLGGLLLMVPGLVSDAAALLCLFPPTAKLLRRGAERRLSGLAGGDLGDAMRQARSAQEQARIHRPDGRIVQGEVLRDDDGPPAR
ncbi:FxsA family protein [Streptomyces sp. RKND-216]|uniref:FxsA family membrane protein n=1 Tax=Streptomyces sp. RKND-216 TaxID=2562581 RepID=UPI00109E2D1F|nr:FxsA family membrane protein [Streptomyces sp. RKND-216]THA27392.1 FxsA family protein [Streptomyces sp. RKND-216]